MRIWVNYWRCLQKGVHILHFIGHGDYDDRNQDGMLLFEDRNGRAHPVNGEQLGAVLQNFDSLRLVVLNACEGARDSIH